MTLSAITIWRMVLRIGSMGTARVYRSMGLPPRSWSVLCPFCRTTQSRMPFCYQEGFQGSRGLTFSYIQACGTLTFRMALYPTFNAVWRRYVPHIMITTPKTDLCWTCQQNSFAITASSNKTDSEKARVKTCELLMINLINHTLSKL